MWLVITEYADVVSFSKRISGVFLWEECFLFTGTAPSGGSAYRWTPSRWERRGEEERHPQSFCLVLGGPKSSFGFSVKKKDTFFHFHQEVYWTMYSPFCSTTFCHFSGNFVIPSSQNYLSFWAKNWSRCLLQSFRELKFSPLREYCKDRNKWISEGAMSDEYGGWIRTSQLSCNSFCLVIKETCSLALSWWKSMRFLLTNSGRFSSSAVFTWSNWEQYLLELIIWFSGRSSV